MKKSNKSMKQLVISSAFAAGAMLAVPTVGEAALGDQTLKQGMNHNDVKELQDVLKSKGHFTYHTSTGYFGTITRDALLQYQRANNLSQTGIADTRTLQSLTNNTTSVASSSSGPLATTQTLRNGSRGSQVSNLQQALNAAGHNAGAVDGIFGRLTEQAVRSYQQANRLTVDGLAGVQTLTSLNGGSANTSTPKQPEVSDSSSNSSANSTVLRKGVRGQAVTQLQGDLKRLGFFSANATGLYGDITVKSVRDFQRKHGLTVDGIAGPQTFNKIASLISGKNDQGAADTAGFNVMNLVADASEHLGVPYVWGGNSPQQGFDCSGFIVYAFNQQNVQLPRTVAQMWNVGQSVSKPQVGDIVFFATTSSSASHAGIYIGNNKFIQSGTSTGVTISEMGNSYWSPRYLGAKRLH